MVMYKNRDAFSGISASIGRSFGRIGLPANVYTILALFVTFVTGYFLLAGNFVCAAISFAIAAFLDSVDGAVARYRKEASARGAYLDTISDRYMEGIISIALLLVPLPEFYLPAYFWIGVYFFGSMTITYVKAAAKEKLNKDIRGGLLERPERMMLLFLGIFSAVFSVIYLVWFIVLLAFLTNITALQRIFIALESKK